MIRYPARHYIHYLWSKRVLKTSDLLKELDDLGLPMPQTEAALKRFTTTLLRERVDMVVPSGFNPEAENPSQATLDFLKRWKILDIWRGDSFVSGALDILEQPQVRRMTEALLLGPMSPLSVAQRVANRFGLPPETMNVRVVRAFSHYFWDISAMSIPEWREMVTKWTTIESNNDYIAALSAPRSPAGAALVLAIVDRNADSLGDVDRYTALRDHGFNLFMEHALLSQKPSLSRTQGAFMAFNMVKMADEELTKRRGGSAELLDELGKIETHYDGSRIRSVKELPAMREQAPVDAIIVEEDTVLTATEDKEIA